MATCEEFRALLEAAAEGSLTQAERGQLTAHEQDCPACLAEEMSTAALLDAVRLPPPSRRDEVLLQTLPTRLQASLASAPRPQRWARRVGAVAAFAAAAMVAAVVAAVVVGPLSRTTRPGPGAAAAPQLATMGGESGAWMADGSELDEDSAMADVAAFEDVDTGLSTEGG